MERYQTELLALAREIAEGEGVKSQLELPVATIRTADSRLSVFDLFKPNDRSVHISPAHRNHAPDGRPPRFL